MILVDAHVHIYDCFDLTKFFDSAYANFKSAADSLGHGDDFIGILLLAETSRDNWFRHLSECAKGKDLPDNKTTGTWKLCPTEEAVSLYARSENNRNLILIGGRQLVTAERLEFLALATTEFFKDGIPIKKLLDTVLQSGGIPVIPWGVGKWTGKRGKIIKNWLNRLDKVNFFLGDNSGRPILWPRPWLFKKAEALGMHILPGSDPLPVTDGYKRTGAFGFILKKTLPEKNPSKSLKTELDHVDHRIQTYGRLEGLIPFIRNQFAIRLKG